MLSMWASMNQTTLNTMRTKNVAFNKVFSWVCSSRLGKITVQFLTSKEFPIFRRPKPWASFVLIGVTNVSSDILKKYLIGKYIFGHFTNPYLHFLYWDSSLAWFGLSIDVIAAVCKSHLSVLNCMIWLVFVIIHDVTICILFDSSQRVFYKVNIIKSLVSFAVNVFNNSDTKNVINI